MSDLPISLRMMAVGILKEWTRKVREFDATAGSRENDVSPARPAKSLLWRVLGIGILLVAPSSFVVVTASPSPNRELVLNYALVAGISLAFAVTGPLFIAWLLLVASSRRLDAMRRLTRLGTSAGTGTAGGFLLAVVAFYYASLINSGGSGERVVREPAAYDTGLFVTLPALGAALGFTLGLFLVVIDTARESKRPALTVILSPIVVTICATMTSLVMSPPRAMESLFEMLAVSNPHPASDSWQAALFSEKEEILSSFLPGGWFVLVVAMFSVAYAWAAARRLLLSAEGPSLEPR
ncbi:hypothetical protein [Gordonia sp. MP11Mi]|uniref:hypothetical protein n=1 Tax=Gordonia sp. MP11Mi TaxID=3022769 RepID=UPI003B21DC60